MSSATRSRAGPAPRTRMAICRPAAITSSVPTGSRNRLSSVRPLPRHGEAGLSSARCTAGLPDKREPRNREGDEHGGCSCTGREIPVRDRRAARSERKRRRPGWHLVADKAQTLRHRRRSASWALQRSSDAFCPALDLGPVTVVAEPAAESMEEQARGQRPLMSLDRASEDPVLARVNRILELADLPGLAPHQLAEPTMRVTEQTDTEQPHWPCGKRGAVGAQELGRARDPALVVDGAAEPAGQSDLSWLTILGSELTRSGDLDVLGLRELELRSIRGRRVGAVCADGKDGVGCHRGADCVLLAPGVAGDRAPGLGSR